jgi:glycosyltransferase involved in cell wall biosynthesis
VTIVDVAGAATGGAARWRREAKEWVASQQRQDTCLIGEGERVTPRWLLQRELTGWRGRRIAANNISFVGGMGPRVVLLRNPLHFLRPAEVDRLPGLRRKMAGQTRVVRTAVRRADFIVVPCSDMADRVTRELPELGNKVIVRHHPVGVRVHPRREDAKYILFPYLVAPHKDLVGGVGTLIHAVEDTGIPVKVKVTTQTADLGSWGCHPMVEAVGPQDTAAMDKLWEGAAAVYCPSTIESFGYPVAEGRAIGVPVIAVDTAQNREIADRALCGFQTDDLTSLSAAVGRALETHISPDPRPFDPKAYFSWLVSL